MTIELAAAAAPSTTRPILILRAFRAATLFVSSKLIAI